MPITFPNSPSTGDTHTTSNGLQYTYDGEKWTTIGTNSAGTWTRTGTTVSLTTATDDLSANTATFSGAVNFDDNVIVKGDGTNGSGELTLNCENNSHGIKIKGPPHSAGATYTLTLPNNTGTSGQVLTTNGSGVSSWSTVDLSSRLPLTGGTLTGGLTGTTANFSSNVGIGTSSPRAKVDFGPGSGYGTLNQTLSNYQAVFEGPQGTGNISRNIAFAVTTGGICAAINATDEGGSNATGLMVATGTAGAISERLRIDSSGNVGVGSTSPQGNLSFGASVSTINTDTSDGSDNKRLALNGGGGGINSGRGGYIVLSGNEATNPGNVQLSMGNASGTSIVFNKGDGSEVGRWDSSGRLLVGTSTARNKFFNTTYTPQLQLEGVGQQQSMFTLTNSVANTGGSVIGLSKQRSGTIGGNTIVNSGDSVGQIDFFGSDGTEMVALAEISASVDGTPGANDMPGRLVFSTTADGASSPTERLRIDSSGRVLLGCSTVPNPGAATTSSGFGINGTNNNAYISAKIDNGPVGYFRRDGSNGTLFDFRKGSTGVGSISVTSSATAFNTSSDYRLKENVINIADGITRVKQLSPKRFNFIVDADKTVDGFIAHEAQVVVPEAVTGEKDGEEMQGIDQSKLVPLLTAALQEAIAKIETLEQRLSDAGIA